MEKEFVPYELALKLKESGFDEPSIAFYEGRVLKNYSNPFLETQLSNLDFEQRREGFRADTCVAPLWQQVQRWLRGKDVFISVDIWDVSSGTKNIDKGRTILFKTYIDHFKEIDGFRQKQKRIQVKGDISNTDFAFSSYEEAIKSGVIEALKLI